MLEVVVRPLAPADHGDWRKLWTAYLAFYEAVLPDDVFETTWRRLFTEGEFEPKGFLATVESKPVGLVHYLYHRTCWSPTNNCYLQDLFVEPDVRGKGVGGALIKAVQAEALKINVTNVYWMTRETNAAARRLYDQVARRTGFIEYDLQ